jgi:sugar/nucleoside kinase (ribokinase family)
VIVVIGALGLRGSVDEPAPDGLAPEIARSAAAAGARVELISKAGDDPAGDAVLIALARAGVGHVATLRDPSRLTPVRLEPAEPTDPADAALDAAAGPRVDAAADPAGDRAEGTSAKAGPSTAAPPALDAADVALALRYLTDFEVLVSVHPTPELLAEAVSAAGWTGARLVVVVGSDTEVPKGVPADALVVAATADDAEGVGARIGRYAAALSRGDDAAAAYRDLTATPSA